MVKTISYLSFLIKSTNAHGVHSPFVFNYVTQCLYKGPRRSRNKAADVLLKSLAYFSCTTIHLVGNQDLRKRLASKNQKLQWGAAPFDLLYLQHPEGIRPEAFFSQFPLHNDSVILVAQIRQSKKNYALWRQLIQYHKVTVSIDLFHCGVMFIRKEQVKQHFYIRV